MNYIATVLGGSATKRRRLASCRPRTRSRTTLKAVLELAAEPPAFCVGQRPMELLADPDRNPARGALDPVGMVSPAPAIAVSADHRRHPANPRAHREAGRAGARDESLTALGRSRMLRAFGGHLCGLGPRDRWVHRIGCPNRIWLNCRRQHFDDAQSRCVRAAAEGMNTKVRT